MCKKILHILLLVSFLNMLTFDRSKHMELLFGSTEVVTDTLFELLLDDLMHLGDDAVDGLQDPEIVYEEFRNIGSNVNAILPIFYFFAGLVFSVRYIFQCRNHPGYVSKMLNAPGYYSFLYRLRLF